MVDHRQLQVDHELVVTRMHNKDGPNCSNNSSVFFSLGLALDGRRCLIGWDGSSALCRNNEAASNQQQQWADKE